MFHQHSSLLVPSSKHLKVRKKCQFHVQVQQCLPLLRSHNNLCPCSCVKRSICNQNPSQSSTSSLFQGSSQKAMNLIILHYIFRVNNICTNNVESFYTVNQLEIIMYDNFIDFYNIIIILKVIFDILFFYQLTI